MCAMFTSLASAVMLAALLVSGAGADEVTTQQCSDYGKPVRVRQYPEDRAATKFDVRSCGQTVLNEGDVVGLPNIIKIDLAYSRMSQIDLAIFSHVPTLEYLSLQFNLFRELPAFPKDSCPHLTELHLCGNQFTGFNDPGTFFACPQLKTLALCANQIAYIHADLFSSLTELEELVLFENKLAFIPDRMFTHNLKLRELWLGGNKLTYLPQDFASSFKHLRLLRFDSNPWQCACLLELLADLKKSSAAEQYSWSKVYDGKRPACAHIRAAPCCRHPLGLLLHPRTER